MSNIKNLILIALLLLLTACGKKISNSPKALPPTYGIEAEFVPLVDDFYIEASSRGLNLPRNLVLVSKSTLSAGGANTIGVCFYPTAERRFPYVEVKKSFWDSANYEAKRNLIYHELGHCLLYRDHTTSQQFAPNIGKTIPLSIMFPYIIMAMSSDIINFYLNYESDYIEELFNENALGTIRGYASNSSNDGFDPNYIPTNGGYSSTELEGECNHSLGDK